MAVLTLECSGQKVQQHTDLDCGLQLHSVCLAQHNGDCKDWYHFSLVVPIQNPGHILKTALDSVPQRILHLFVNLYHTQSHHVTRCTQSR